MRDLVSPRLLPLHLLGLAAVIAAVWLGVWQFGAWQAERAAAARDVTNAEPVAVEQAISPDEPFPSDAVGRPVELSGRWLPDASFFVTGRENAGQDGVWAVTPVAVCEAPDTCDRSPALLVVRGWTTSPAEAPEPPSGEVSLTGWLQPPEGTGRPDPDPRDDSFPELRIADAIQRVDQDLYGAFLVAEESTPTAGLEGLENLTPAQLPDPGGNTGLRNFLYAAEWWVFGAFALFLWWRWTRDELARGRREETKTTAEQSGAATPAEVRSKP